MESNGKRKSSTEESEEHNMGLFSNLFSKKNTAAVQPQPVQMPEEKNAEVYCKSQRFNPGQRKDHMEDIMDLVEKNEDYKLKKKDLIEENRGR